MRDIKVKFRLKSLPKITGVDFQFNKTKNQVSYLEKIKKNKINGGIFFVTLFIIVFGIFMGLISGHIVRDVYRKAISAQSNIEKIYLLTKQEDYKVNIEQINSEISSSKQMLESADSSMTKINFLGGIPFIGRGMDTINNLVKSGFHTVSALDLLVKNGQPIFNSFGDSLTKKTSEISISDSRIILSSFLEIKPTIDQSLKDLKRAEVEMSRIPFFLKFGKIKKVCDIFDANVPQIQTTLTDMSLVAEKLPQILGFNGERQYILFFLNNNEMTLGGGFPGSLAILKVKNGQMSDFKIENIYNFEKEKNVSLLGPFHYSPDFPSIVKKINENLKKSGSFHDDVDGVVTVDTEILKEILKITGPIQVENAEYGYNYILNESNVIDIIERHTKKSYYGLGEPVTERKEILNILLEQILAKAPELEKGSMVKFISSLGKLSNEKHLKIYFKDKELQDLAKRYNMTGEIEETNGDYCLVTDDNFAYSKSHQVLEKKIKYKLDFENKKAELSLDYFLNSPANWKIWDILSFTKVYLPSGTEIIKNEGFSVNTPDDSRLMKAEKMSETKRSGKSIFSGWLKVLPTEKRNFKLFYYLPSNIFSRKEYKLIFQKQPGIINTALEVEIELPNDKKIKKIEPEGYVKEGNKIYWKTDLLKDKEFKITF